MKIIDAFWEKRNLGVTCYELQMNLTDGLKEVEEKLESLKERQYMVAKIPSARYDLVQLFQNKGYTFIETAIKLEYNYKKLGYKLPDMAKGLKKICDRCSRAVMDESELFRLSSEIKKGIFKTDRIYIDPEFTHEQAARRYDLWVKDLVKQGNIPHKVLFDGETVGFFINRECAPKTYDGMLAGVYSGYEGTGMGYCIQYAGILDALQRGMDKYIGHISGNNPAVLKIMVSLNFPIKELEYVFIKHNNKGE